MQIDDHEATFLADLDRALTVMTRFLTQAERVSLQSFRHTATVDA